MIQVTKNLFVETGMVACNVAFLVTGDGVVVIDTPMRPTDAIKFRDEAAKRGEIKYVVNTEEHADHWQCSHFFPGILITHQETRRKLTKETLAGVMARVKMLDPNGVPLMKDYKVRLPDVTFDENLNFYLGDHTIQLFHLPGHTVGGIGVYIPEEKAAFTTDIVFHKLKSYLHESNPSHWLNSLQKLWELDTEVIVPGHGDIIKGKDYLQEEAGIVRAWVDAVKGAIKKGLSLEEAQVQVICPDPYPKQPMTPMTEPELNKAIITHLYKLYSKV